MPGRRYSATTTDTNTANTTAIAIQATTAVRPQLYDLLVSSVATPADNAGEYIIKRFTAGGTSTAGNSAAIDSGDPAATSTIGVNHSAEPTYTANTELLAFATNMRATFRWVAAPESELKAPATSSNGLGLLQNAIGGSAVVMRYQLFFAE